MASSPESAQLPSDGSQAGSRTPTRTTSNPPAGGLSELSPPGSQTQPTFTNVGSSVPGTTPGSTAPEDQPGAMWLNKRAEEEYQRAMEFVVDKDFNLNEFGDPFDERDMQAKAF
ncbi:hypothetical protein P170DRAFT_432641 [Aspergillus steynii IBT 23096]|uniref:Uncharacterized protein n=1 Tax=Aspergillus steynii IBT 23096 TaxID=1392250 RepID=A0A2I2GQF2_9EURO|nr:uncharacterized protein P170DRAFT_432641 [Aspergillus steynii IBT 23096]PLB55100.1 hypothetical protein P170DRAFT_432641 [Aspergillus steynii IBT 23096]